MVWTVAVAAIVADIIESNNSGQPSESLSVKSGLQPSLNESPATASPEPVTTTTPTTSPVEVRRAVPVENDTRPIYVVTAPDVSELNIRSEPKQTGSTIVARVRHGDHVFLEEGLFQNTDPPAPVTWQRVTSLSGYTGWIRADYITPLNEPNRNALLGESGSAKSRPSAEDAEVRQLFEQWFRASNDGSPEQEAALYSDPTDYLDLGTLSHPKLLEELKKDHERWPQHMYSTFGRAPLIEKVNDSEWRVTFKINFDVRNPYQRKRVTGTANLAWTVRKRATGRVEIASAKEQVTSRTYGDVKRTNQ
jgi:hypothetical protein